MLFNSWGYLFFLTLGVGCHWLIPHRARTYLLAALSILFYAMWRWDFSLLMIFSASVDFVASTKIGQTQDPRNRKRWLLLSLLVNLGLLVFFKYTYFLYGNVQALLTSVGTSMPDLAVTIILPLGISFYTFQTISYTIDVYRGVIQPTRDFPIFLTYVTFWPQLIAGPVLRAKEVIPQLQAKRSFSWHDMSVGSERVVFGLFKKVVLADNIAPLVDTVFAMDAANLTALDVWVGAFLFGFQIYFDFGGYSDVAIGSARMMGIKFPDNFNWPYMATSPKDLWRRWHISLSSWIRDYLYLPLTGQRFRTESKGGMAVGADNQAGNPTAALLLTWFIMGLWHGAGWTFALWGVYHACLVILYRKLPFLHKMTTSQPMLSWAMMLPLTMAGWISFRAINMSQCLTMYFKLISPVSYTLSSRALSGSHYLAAAALVLSMVIAFCIHWLSKQGKLPSLLHLPRMATVATAVFLILIYLRPVRQFIYLQF